jgi:hypothetical protein
LAMYLFANEIVLACGVDANPLPFWLETLSIFLGDVFAAFFLSVAAVIFWYVMKYPGFRVGANWTFTGWDFQKMGRFPGESDEGSMEIMPNISVTSRDMTIKKVIVGVWVRERADVNNPGKIAGHLDLKRAGMPIDARTTGGDILNLPGPRIPCQAHDFARFIKIPIFIQTSDGEFHQAQSPGNPLEGLRKIRYKCQDIFHAAKQWIQRKL